MNDNIHVIDPREKHELGPDADQQERDFVTAILGRHQMYAGWTKDCVKIKNSVILDRLMTRFPADHILLYVNAPRKGQRSIFDGLNCLTNYGPAEGLLGHTEENREDILRCLDNSEAFYEWNFAFFESANLGDVEAEVRKGISLAHNADPLAASTTLRIDINDDGGGVDVYINREELFDSFIELLETF